MPGGDGGSCGGGRKGVDDDIHFRNEERKKKWGWVMEGGVLLVYGGRENSSSGGEEEGEKKNASLGSNQNGGVFFCLRLEAAVTDGCVRACTCARCCGAHPSAFPGDAGGRGRRLLWLVKSSPLY